MGCMEECSSEYVRIGTMSTLRLFLMKETGLVQHVDRPDPPVHSMTEPKS